MFKRDEAARLRQEFWTTFGKYMSPVPSAEGLAINWINYRTGIKHVYFRMDVTNKAAEIYISLEHPDAALRLHCYQQFQQLQIMLQTEVAEEWTWHSEVVRADKTISIISKALPDVSVFNKAQWAT